MVNGFQEIPGFTGLPGAVAVSHLRVYDWPAADGVSGGTPHLHLTCSEAYVVTGGRGAVQTLTASGYEVTPLTPGTVAWFTPGTIHRLVDEGDLRITVLMQNGGLPEAGDAVLTLPRSISPTRGRTPPRRSSRTTRPRRSANGSSGPDAIWPSRATARSAPRKAPSGSPRSIGPRPRWCGPGSPSGASGGGAVPRPPPRSRVSSSPGWSGATPPTSARPSSGPNSPQRTAGSACADGWMSTRGTTRRETAGHREHRRQRRRGAQGDREREARASVLRGNPCPRGRAATGPLVYATAGPVTVQPGDCGWAVSPPCSISWPHSPQTTSGTSSWPHVCSITIGRKPSSWR